MVHDKVWTKHQITFTILFTQKVIWHIIRVVFQITIDEDTPISNIFSDEDGCLLGYCTVQFDRYWPTFQRNLLPPSTGWWQRQYAPLKRRSISTRLHGTTSQKTAIFILIAIRTWNLEDMFSSCFLLLWNLVSYVAKAYTEMSESKVRLIKNVGR
jgi:hypothetical protein